MSSPSNITNWQATVPHNLNIYDEESTQSPKLGSKITVGDRKFAYASAGAALTPGQFVASPVSTLSVKQTAGAAAAIGATSVTAYVANSAGANAFAEGYMIVQDSAGEGFAYKVKDHAAIGDTSTGTVTIYDGLKVALTTVSVLTFIPNKYSGVTNVINGTTPVVGVAQATVTSGNYFWAQVSGPAAVKVSTTVAYGSTLIPGTTGAATVIAASANAQVLGTVLSAATTADSAAAFLKIDND